MGPNMRVTGASFSRERLGSAAAGVLRAAAEPRPRALHSRERLGSAAAGLALSCCPTAVPCMSPPGRGRP